MDDLTKGLAAALGDSIAKHSNITKNLLRLFPKDWRMWRYMELSFCVSMVRQIHSGGLAGCEHLLASLSDKFNSDREFFMNCEYTRDDEKKWANKYLTHGADFNNNFLFCVTTRCNKKCKYCMVFSPYLDVNKTQYDPSFEELCAEIDGLFSIIDSAAGIQFGGGEPCIRKDLPALIDHVGKYRDKITKYTALGTGFGIITNASVAFSDELLEASKRFGPQLVWLLDDYHFSMGESIAEKLRANGINYVLRDQKTQGVMHCDGWLNFFNDYTGPVDIEKARLYNSKCGQAQSIFQFIIANGSIYPCCRSMVADMYWPGNDRTRETRVDIFDTEVSREQKVQRLKDLLCANHYFTCCFCGGLHGGRKVRLFPGEQLTPEEYGSLKDGTLSLLDFANYDEL